MAAMSNPDRTSVQIRRPLHAKLLRAQLDMSRDKGRRLSLAEVIAALLDEWAGKREGTTSEKAGAL